MTYERENERASRSIADDRHELSADELAHVVGGDGDPVGTAAGTGDEPTLKATPILF